MMPGQMKTVSNFCCPPTTESTGEKLTKIRKQKLRLRLGNNKNKL